MEFSGVDQSGRRVMGLVPAKVKKFTSYSKSNLANNSDGLNWMIMYIHSIRYRS